MIAPEHASMMRLREDAIQRGLLDLAIVYGWAAIRITGEELGRRIREISGKPDSIL